MKEIKLKIDNDMKKQEEIAILEKLKKVFYEHPNNYLTSLFSTEFVSWASQRIRDDFPVDVYEYVNGYGADVDLNKKLADRISELQELQQESVSKVAALQEALSSLRTKYNDDIEWHVNHENELTTRLAAQEDELLRLKAKLYDLQEKEEGK